MDKPAVQQDVREISERTSLAPRPPPVNPDHPTGKVKNEQSEAPSPTRSEAPRRVAATPRKE